MTENYYSINHNTIDKIKKELISEFLEKLEVINRNYKGLIQPIVELIEEYKKRLKV